MSFPGPRHSTFIIRVDIDIIRFYDKTRIMYIGFYNFYEYIQAILYNFKKYKYNKTQNCQGHIMTRISKTEKIILSM